jgi:hypothetical protein
MSTESSMTGLELPYCLLSPYLALFRDGCTFLQLHLMLLT